VLVIRRRAGESFLIGEEIEIEVLEISGTQVKLGITAPRNIAIWRKEVQLIRQQNQAASVAVSPEYLGRLAVKFQATGPRLPRPRR